MKLSGIPITRYQAPFAGMFLRASDAIGLLNCYGDGIEVSEWHPYIQTAAARPTPESRERQAKVRRARELGMDVPYPPLEFISDSSSLIFPNRDFLEAVGDAIVGFAGVGYAARDFSGIEVPSLYTVVSTVASRLGVKVDDVTAGWPKGWEQYGCYGRDFRAPAGGRRWVELVIDLFRVPDQYRLHTDEEWIASAGDLSDLHRWGSYVDYVAVQLTAHEERLEEARRNEERLRLARELGIGPGGQS